MEGLNKYFILLLPTIVNTFLSCLALFAQNATDHIALGNRFAKEFDNEKALAEYLQAYQADTSNCTALWRIAEAYINLGEEAEKSIKSQYYYMGEKWAKRAVNSCPCTANGYFFVAVASGQLALYDGGKNKVNRSKEVKAAAEKALELDPNHHGAYHILGRWHTELASLNWFLKAAAKIVYGGVPPGASYEAAVANFKKAIEISPNWINHHRQLGELYMRMKEWELARQEFKLALQLPIADHEDERHKKKCRKLLKKIQNK